METLTTQATQRAVGERPRTREGPADSENQDGLDYGELAYTKAYRDWSKHYKRIRRAGGRLVWRQPKDESVKSGTVLVTESPDSMINRDYSRVAKHFDGLLDQYNLLNQSAGEQVPEGVY